MTSLLTMNASAFPFYPSHSPFSPSPLPSSPSHSPPSLSSSAFSPSTPHHKVPTHSHYRHPPFRTPSSTIYHTAPASSFPSASSSTASLSSFCPSPSPRPAFYAPGEFVTDLPLPGPPLSLFHPQLRSLSGHAAHGTLTSIASTASFPSSSPQSSPPYSPRDDHSPPPSSMAVLTASRFGTAQLSLVHDSHHSDCHRRLSDSSTSSPYSSSISSTAPAPLPALGSVDPRAYDPDRLSALLAVVFHMEGSGSHAKFLSQLGILYKQMFPHLFVKGMLKDLVDYAVVSGFLKLTGPAGQQQVHLTAKARMGGPQALQPVLQQLAISQPHTPAQSPSPVSSPSSNSPSAVDEEDNRSAGHHQRTRSGSQVGMFMPSSSTSSSSSSRHSRAHSLQYTNSARATPNTSPQLVAASATPLLSLPALSISPSSLPPLPSSSSCLSTLSSSSSLYLSPPAPTTALEEKYFRFEKPRHLKYMFHFRVHACKPALTKSCTAGDSLKKSGQSSSGSDCFDYHSAAKTRRRVPRIVSYTNGTFWSYNACRCQAIEKEIKCEKGDACRYSHNKEEIAYHPSRYKTQPCSYPARADGICTRFGLHCAYAHGEDDIRRPILLKQGMPHRLLTDDSNNGVSPSVNNAFALTGAIPLFPSTSAGELHSRRGSLTGDEMELFHLSSSEASGYSLSSNGTAYLDPDEFMTPKDSLMTDRSFYLYQYKVRPCTDPSPACSQGSCPHYHYDNKRRRSPKLFKYSHDACQAVKPDAGAQWKRPSACTLGDACPFAHTLLEAMYHPEVYKTVLCSNFDERDPSTWRRCQWGRMCAHAHSKAELDFNALCQRQGEAAALQTFAGQQLPQQSTQPQQSHSHSAAMAYEPEKSHARGLPVAPLALFYRDGRPKDTKPPLPPLRPSTAGHSMALNHSSPTPQPQPSSGATISPLTSPQSMSSLWSKPIPTSASSSLTSPSTSSSTSTPPSNASSPIPTSHQRQPNPIQPRLLTPISSDLASFFTPLGPTLLRDGHDEDAVDDDDSIIIPSHPFSSSSTSSSPSPSTFLSPLSSSLHNWQTPSSSGSLTPSSVVHPQPLFTDFDASFMDGDKSRADLAQTTTSSSPASSTSTPNSAELQRLRSQLREELDRSSEVQKENVALRQQLQTLTAENASSASELSALSAQLNAYKAKVAELERAVSGVELSAPPKQSDDVTSELQPVTTEAAVTADGIASAMDDTAAA